MSSHYSLPPRHSVAAILTLCTISTGGRDDGLVLLDKVFRQQNDTVFLNILNDLRMGVVTPQAQRILGGKVQESYRKDREATLALTSHSSNPARGAEENAADNKAALSGDRVGPAFKKGFAIPKAAEQIPVRPTKLFSTNKDVDAYNLAELQKLGEQDADGDLYR
jgi:hypothetical protein